MRQSFRKSLDTYLTAWRNSSLAELKEFIPRDYKAREISGGKIVDFGYEESINGWEQGFQFVNENNGQWSIKEHSIVPLRAQEVLVILSATIIIDGKSLDTVNLFFETFKEINPNEWKMVRSYVEAGVPIHNLEQLEI